MLLVKGLLSQVSFNFFFLKFYTKDTSSEFSKKLTNLLTNCVSDLVCGVTLESNALFLLLFFVTKKVLAVEKRN